MKPNDKPCMDVWHDSKNGLELPATDSSVLYFTAGTYRIGYYNNDRQRFVEEQTGAFSNPEHISGWCYLYQIGQALQSHNELQTKVAELESDLEAEEEAHSNYAEMSFERVQEINKLDIKVAMLEKALSIAKERFEYMAGLTESIAHHDTFIMESKRGISDINESIAEITKTKE